MVGRFRVRASHGIAAILISSLALGRAAHANIVQTSPGYFQCSTKPGMMVREDIGTYSANGEIHGRVHLIADRTDPDWWPTAAFLFELNGKRAVGVAVTKVRGDPDHIYSGVWKHEMPILRIAAWDTDAWIPLSAKLDENGQLTVTAGQFSKSVNVGRGTVVRRVIHCNSGAFDFDLRPGTPPPSNQIGSAPIVALPPQPSAYLEITVGADGVGKNCKVLQSSGDPAGEALACRYFTSRPQKVRSDKDGRPVEYEWKFGVARSFLLQLEQTPQG